MSQTQLELPEIQVGAVRQALELPMSGNWVTPHLVWGAFPDCGTYAEEIEAVRTYYPEAKSGHWYWVQDGERVSPVSIWDGGVKPMFRTPCTCVWVGPDEDDD